jgi:endonuclease G, mitochondrial
MKLALLLLSLYAAFAFGHGGGLNGQGGHFNRSTGEYHCHREPCFSLQSKTPNEEITPQVKVTAQADDGSCNGLLPFGRPDTGEILLCRTGYAAGFDCNTRSALWVAYEITPAIHNSANVPRSDDFRADPELPAACRKELSDFGRGYDRGHLVSSATLDATRQMNSETFLLSNMSPQLPKFNRAIWKGLENRERKWSNQRGRVYVITGPVFANSKQNGRIMVPSHFYKIIFDPSKNEAISFLLPHKALYTAQLSRYRVSIDVIEEASGINFFAELEDDVEDELEAEVARMMW